MDVQFTLELQEKVSQQTRNTASASSELLMCGDGRRIVFQSDSGIPDAGWRIFPPARVLNFTELRRYSRLVTWLPTGLQIQTSTLRRNFITEQTTASFPY